LPFWRENGNATGARVATPFFQKTNQNQKNNSPTMRYPGLTWSQYGMSLLALTGIGTVWRYNVSLLVCNTGGIIRSEVSEKRVVAMEPPATPSSSSSTIIHAANQSLSGSISRSDMRPASLAAQDTADDLLVQQGDFVYLRGDWDGSPVVLEDYKLVFFTSAKVGCTVWKQLFRRIVGLKDWKAEATGKLLPWNPELNGLKYLYDYNRETASHMMTSPEYTRAIFVREPKERLVSAYLDKGVTNSYFMQSKCCFYKGDCTQVASKYFSSKVLCRLPLAVCCVLPKRSIDRLMKLVSPHSTMCLTVYPLTFICCIQLENSLDGFFQIMQTCEDAHWRPQSRRMEPKYWPYINFVGHMETVEADAARLLKQVGAWDPYGSSGWGKHGNLSIFGTKAGGAGRKHATHAKDRMRAHFTPELEQQVESYYSSDYANLVLNVTRIPIFDAASR
jgi:hypothetical protein